MLQLVLRDNDLIELPKELGNLSRLKELHLQNNRLTALPPELGTVYIYSAQHSKVTPFLSKQNKIIEKISCTQMDHKGQLKF